MGPTAWMVCSGAALVTTGLAAGLVLSQPPPAGHTDPIRVVRSDRLVVEQKIDDDLPEVPVLPQPVPPLRIAAPVPPEEVEQEEYVSTPSLQAEPKRTKRDVCAKHGGVRETYYRGRREMWRCRYKR
jgi:hypothetical protein